MSRTNPTRFEIEGLDFECRCGAAPDQWCLTTGGNPSVHLHTDRIRQIYQRRQENGANR